MIKKYKFIFSFIFLLFLFSCSPNRYVNSGQYIIDKVEIKVDNPKIKKSKLYSITETQGLKKIFNIFALRARLYYIPNPKNDKKRALKKKNKLKRKNQRIKNHFYKQNAKLDKKWKIYYNKVQSLENKGDTVSKKYQKTLRKYKEYHTKYVLRSEHSSEIIDSRKKEDVYILADFWHNIGQKPQILNPYFIDITEERYKTFLKNNAYFQPDISCKIDTISKKRVKLTYYIKTGPPLKIGSISYQLPKDPKFNKYFMEIDNKLKLKPGTELNIDALQNFSNTIVNYYRNRGYYFFTNQLISYDIDTNGRYSHSALTVKFKTDVDSSIYKQWYIKNISIFNDYSSTLAMQDTGYFNNLQIIPYPPQHPDFYYIKKYRTVIKPKYLSKELYLHSDSLYSLKSTQYTYSHLSKFNIYKLTNIEFEKDTSTLDTTNMLNCFIKLTPDKITNLVFQAEATNTSMNNGGAANVSFIHNNLFHGGEILNFQFKLALEKQKTFDSTSTNIFNTQEYSFDINLTIPRLLSPFKTSEFIRRNNPRTVINMSFSFQDRPEYNKIAGLLTMEYLLKSSSNSSFIITPVRFSSIKVPYIAPDFERLIIRTSLAQSYADHFILGSKITYLNTNQGKEGNNYYFQLNFMPAGNLLNYITSKISDTTSEGYYNFPGLNTAYSQFVKGDFDFRFYWKPNKLNTLVTRLFAGIGVPYGNSKIMPFNEKYFAGGANSIRGWQARTLGPGEYKIPNGYSYVNQLGDIKIETNFEYRFDIVGPLEGALFIDCGNIWEIKNLENDESRIFYFNKFYKQMAVASGTGIRLNLSYFVLRLDLGVKLSDPSLPEGRRFIPFERKFNTSDFTINIAIGYPF